MGITQKDIARDLGIAFVTVNRALNNSGYVSDDLKQRIFSYVEKKGYVPSRASQALVKNKARRLALFSSSNVPYFWDEVDKGIVSAAEPLKAFNYEVQYHRIIHSNTEPYIKSLQDEIKSGAEAVGFVNQPFYDMKEIFSVAEKAGVPYITFNIDDPGSNRLSYIGCDYAGGGRLAANFIGKALTLKKNARVLVIGVADKTGMHVQQHPIFGERLDGFLAVMNEVFPEIAIDITAIEMGMREKRSDRIQSILQKFEHKVDAVHVIMPYNKTFLDLFSHFDYRNCISVVYDMDSSVLRCLKNNLLTAAVYQNPFLQGYKAVKTLEYIIETKCHERLADVEITHDMIFRENIKLTTNNIYWL